MQLSINAIAKEMSDNRFAQEASDRLLAVGWKKVTGEGVTKGKKQRCRINSYAVEQRNCMCRCVPWKSKFSRETGKKRVAHISGFETKGEQYEKS